MPSVVKARRGTVFAALFLVCCVLSAISCDQDARHHHEAEWDYVVIGGGTAGCVIAARLSADPRNRVLLLSNGEDQTGRIENTIPLVTSNPVPVPSDYARFADSKFSTEGPTYGASGRKSSVLLMPRLLGGASSLNGAAFTRPDNGDYVRLVQEYGMPSWTVSRINAIWQRIETFIPNNNGSIPAGHGTSGPIQSRAISPDQFLSLYTEALRVATGESVNPDNGLGVVRGTGVSVRSLGGYGNVTETGKFVRQDSYNKYIVPVLGRNNLRVVDRATVLQVSTDDECAYENEKHDWRCRHSSSHRTPRINKVTYVRYGSHETVRVRSGGEVILSAGALRSPEILMHSGIGNCGDLIERGIQCLKDIPAMGKRIYDHVAFATFHLIPAPSPDWQSHMGSFTSTYTSSRIDNITNLEITATGYPPAGLPNYHLIITQAVLTKTSSFGELHLKDGDWLTPANVSLGIFKNDTDRDALVYAFRKIVSASQIAGVPMSRRAPSTTTLPDDASDDAIKAWLKEEAVADYHTVGTTPAGRCDQGATVDDKLRVCGVRGLRVADNGIMPFPYTAHSTHAGALIIGEQAADFILSG